MQVSVQMLALYLCVGFQERKDETGVYRWANSGASSQSSQSSQGRLPPDHQPWPLFCLRMATKPTRSHERMKWLIHTLRYGHIYAGDRGKKQRNRWNMAHPELNAELRVLHVRLNDWITFSKHADYVVGCQECRAWSQQVPSVGKGNK